MCGYYIYPPVLSESFHLIKDTAYIEQERDIGLALVCFLLLDFILVQYPSLQMHYASPAPIHLACCT